jgi:hypothetical protein
LVIVTLSASMPLVHTVPVFCRFCIAGPFRPFYHSLSGEQDNRGLGAAIKPFDVSADGQQAVSPDQGIKQSGFSIGRGC